MKTKRVLCLLVATSFLLVARISAQPEFVPIGVFPDPAQFGTVAQNSSLVLGISVNNLSASPVNITGMSITGPNASDFSFDGFECTGTLPVGQGCSMNLLFTPSGMGARSANMIINIQGLITPFTVPLLGTGGNPIPTITSVNPSAVYVNSPTTTVTVNGTGLVSTSFATFDFTNLATTFISSTKLTAVVPASLLTGSGFGDFAVTNPQPGGGFASGTFNVIGLTPSIQTASPTTIMAGTNSSLTLNGGNFMTGAKVLWNNKPIPTTYISTNQLQAQPTTKDLSAPTIAQIAVSNPSPGTISPSMNFDVTYPAKIKVLNLPANDLVWDPFAQRLYASLPSSYGPNGNSIAVINPATAAVNGFHFAGSEPSALALSSGSQFLYVGLNGNGSVQRFILPTFTQDINVGLGTNIFGGLNLAASLQVYPSDPHSWATALGSLTCCGSGPLEFFKDSIFCRTPSRRPPSATSCFRMPAPYTASAATRSYR